MTPEQWEKIGELYHQALELDEDERAAFLEQACAEDEAARREVESLIAADQQARNFIASNALRDAARMVTANVTPAFESGRPIGHYRIESLLGSGGMGEVYLARDTRLGRRVALKLLRPDADRNQKEKNRLLREARSAAALNHPNIVTIYSIEEAGDSIFIVMEYVEGETLSAIGRRGGLGFADVLDVGSQIAGALAAAHSAGLVHRDIKPSNVIVTRQGKVKLLDFGIAKMTKLLAGDGWDDAASHTHVTAEGAIVGTVAYMSPEQIRGETLDARTDIFSLGTVLYEAATGKLPFHGANPLAMMQKVSEAAPAPPSSISPVLPPKFDLLISRALAKEKEQRYPSAEELAGALNELKEELTGDFYKAEGGMRRPDDGAGAESRRTTSESPGERVTDEDSPRTTVITIRRKTAAAFVAAAILVIVATGLVGYELLRQPVDSDTPPEPLSPMETKLTATGNIANARPAVSPDGKYVAYAVMDSERRSSLWIRQLGAVGSALLVPTDEVEYGGIAFSRDGNYVYYSMKEAPNNPYNLYRIPLLGGSPKKVVEDVDSTVSFSPDGGRVVFRRVFYARREGALIVANADGSDEQRVASLMFPETFGDPSWSPDGKVIACSAGHADGGSNRYVVEISTADWTMKPISTRRWRWVGPVEWLSDGKELLMIASDSASEPYRLWRLSYPSGEARRVTNNASFYSRLSLAADSSALIVTYARRNTNVWVVPAANPRLAKRMTFGVGGFRTQLQWTSTGKIVFESNAAGTSDISVMDEDGNNRRQLLGELTAQAAAGAPSVSPDGRFVAFTYDITGARHIWRIDIDGINLIQLTRGGGEDQPCFTADGNWVVYTDIGSERPTLWKVPADGGEAVQITKAFSRWPTPSPDGKLISCFYSTGEQGELKLAVVPVVGGEPVVTFPQVVTTSYRAKWTPDGRALSYIDLDHSNVWLQPVEGGKPRKVTDFTSDVLFGFEWSPDGTRLACVRGVWERDLVLIENFR